LIAALDAAGWNSRSAPVFVQSFEPGSLKEMRAKGLRSRMVQLIDGDDIDLKAGRSPMRCHSTGPTTGPRQATPDSLPRWSPAGLAEIKTYADGIGPWKAYIVPVKGRLDAAGHPVDVNGDGKIDLRDASTQPATTLAADAHRAGPFVHTFTFRNEQRRLASDYRGDPQAEYPQFFPAGGLMAYSPIFPTRQLRHALRCSGKPSAELSAPRYGHSAINSATALQISSSNGTATVETRSRTSAHHRRRQALQH
jgi:glycerophosphoryl diester phosphodiesterase